MTITAASCLRISSCPTRGLAVTTCGRDWQPTGPEGNQHTIVSTVVIPVTTEGPMHPIYGTPLEYMALVTKGEGAAGSLRVSPT